jgi:hypothetical protein
MPAPKFDSSILVWDSEAMFIAAGGCAALRQLLADNQFPTPQIDTVYMWRARRQIPHRWVPMVLYSLLKTNKSKLSALFAYRKPAVIHDQFPDDEDDG